MEKISLDMKVSEFKQSTLCKAFEKLSAEASAILTVSLQWKDLEDHFNSTRTSLQFKLDELAERERVVAAVEAESATRSSVLDSEIESKSKRLADLETLRARLDEEVERRTRDMDSISRRLDERGAELERVRLEIDMESRRLREVEERGREFDSKSRRLDEADRLVSERWKELETLESAVRTEQRELDQLNGRIKERSRELESLERCARQRSEEAELARKNFSLEMGMLNKRRDDLRRSVEECAERLRVSQASVLGQDYEIQVRGEVLYLIQESIRKCEVEFESKRSHLDSIRRELELKQRTFVSLKKSVDKYSREFDGKAERIEGLTQKVHEANRESFGPEFEEIRLIHDKVNECLKEVEMKEKGLVSLRKSVEERAVEIEKREARLKKRSDEFALIQRELDSTRNSPNTLWTKVKIEQFDNNTNDAKLHSFASYQYCTTNGHFLQLLLTEQLKRHEACCNELFAVLQGSPDPAKLVLDAVKGFYPLHPTSNDDLSVIRSSCIFLLEKLMLFAPEISPQVREEAKKLATDWKGRMMVRIENHLEVLGFLQLRDSYKLHNDFDGNEIRRLVKLNHKIRQAFPFEPLLCPADEVPATTKEAGNLTDVVSNCPNLVGEILTQDDILTALQMPDPAKHVLGMVEESFSLLWNRGDQVGSDASFMKRYIFIFEQIARNTLEIKDGVRQDATKLAKEWSSRISTLDTENNHLEALGFLLFLMAYGLVASFTEDDITTFLEIISQDRHSLEQSQNLRLGYDLEAYIQNLVGKKKHVVAVRLACGLKLTDKFSPAKLLTEYMDEVKTCSRRLCQGKKSVEEKDNTTDLEITSLRAVLQCVEDHDLGAEICSDNITKRIGLLEKIKTDRRQAVEFFRETEEQQQQQQQQPISNKRKDSTSSGDDHQQQNQPRATKKKRPKVTIRVKSNDSPVTKPVPQPEQNPSVDDGKTAGDSLQLAPIPNTEADMTV